MTFPYKLTSIKRFSEEHKINFITNALEFKNKQLLRMIPSDMIKDYPFYIQKYFYAQCIIIHAVLSGNLLENCTFTARTRLFDSMQVNTPHKI